MVREAMGNVPPAAAVVPGKPFERSTVLTTPSFPGPVVTSVLWKTAFPANVELARRIFEPSARSEMLHPWKDHLKVVLEQVFENARSDSGSKILVRM